jgi:DNA primase
MPFVDFAELKTRVSIEQVGRMLGLDLARRGAQWRAPCPACRSGGDRALVITPAKQAFYCFGARTGGDLIALVAHVRGVGANEAANEIARHFGTGTSSRNRTSTSTVPREAISSREADVVGKGSARELLKPLDYLLTEHASVQGLGVAADLARAFGAGYAPKGIMRGRLAIPVRDRNGELLAYCGRAVTGDQQPTLIFPNGFQPETVIFNADRIAAGPLYLVRDPLDVLTAFASGIENVVAFLADIGPQSLEMLAGLMDEKKCETVELF